MMDELLKGLARRLADDFGGQEHLYAEFLAETGIYKLLEAGQALREYDTGRLTTGKYLTWTALSVKWDVALAALAGAEKGSQ